MNQDPRKSAPHELFDFRKLKKRIKRYKEYSDAWLSDILAFVVQAFFLIILCMSSLYWPILQIIHFYKEKKVRSVWTSDIQIIKDTLYSG